MYTVLREEGAPLELSETYLAMIRGSIDSRQYQKLFVRSPIGVMDVTDGGNFSCAFYVSSILKLCGLTTGGVHTTVDETIRDMQESGWRPVAELRNGCVLVWAEGVLCSDGRHHKHIGFYLEPDLAVSNHPELRVPKEHHPTFGQRDGRPVRPIREIYYNELITGPMGR